MRIALLSYYYGSISGEEQLRSALHAVLQDHPAVEAVVSVSARRPETAYVPADHPGAGNVELRDVDLRSFDVAIAINCWMPLDGSSPTTVLWSSNVPPPLRNNLGFTADEYLAACGMRADLHLVNSVAVVERLCRAGVSAAYLPLFADERVFTPASAEAGPERNLVFVGNNFPYKGAAIEIYLDPLLDHGPEIYGFPTGWVGSRYERFFRGTLTRAELARVYRTSRICLGITADYQRELGMITNRLFEILACEGVLLSDTLPAPEDPLARYCNAMWADSVSEDYARVLEDFPNARMRARAGAEYVRRHHSAAVRAGELIELCRAVMR